MSRVRKSVRLGLTGLAAVSCIAGAATPSLGQEAVEKFYSGKTLEFIVGYSSGGTYDRYGRLVSRFLGKHIPGKPSIVTRNMPGASSRLAAAYIYGVAPKDGTVLGTADQSLPVAQAMGDTSLKVDVSKLNYIGNPVIDNNVTVTWHTSGVKTVDEAKKREISIGATGGSTSSQYPTVMNALLGTKFKIIVGYPGGNDINLAMERGEVEGRGSWNWVGVRSTRPDWVANKTINMIVQIGLEKEPEISEVPLLMDLASNEADRTVLKLLSAPTTIGRPVFTAPDVPPERVAALRAAFEAMLKDPEFLKAAKTEDLDIRPVGGARLQEIVTDILATPKPIAERLRTIIGLPAG